MYTPFSPGNKVRDALMLCLICMAGFGTYFLYDIPAAIGIDIKTAINIDNTVFQAIFYTIYATPASVSACFGGYIVDRYLGLKWAGILFSGVCFLSQFVISFGIEWKSVFLIGLGRMVTGICNEPLGVVRSTYAAKYFNRALFMGLVLAVSRAGSAGGFNISPQILCTLAPTSLSCLNSTDRETFANNGTKSGYYISEESLDPILTSIFWTFVTGAGVLGLAVISITILGVMDEKIERKRLAAGGELRKKKTPPNLNDVVQLPPVVWTVIIIFMFFYAALFPFNSNIPDYVKRYLGFTKEQASLLASISYLVSIFGAPTFGAVVDLTGNHTLWGMLGCSLLTATLFLWNFLVATMKDTSSTDEIFVIVVGLSIVNGIGYSIVASVYMASIAFLTNQELLATSYGLLFGVQQIGVAALYYLSGWFVDKYGYDYYPAFMGCVSLLSVLGGIFMLMQVGRDPRGAQKHAEENESEEVDAMLSMVSLKA